mmetsp:Transcript_31075/g.41084  ORF Transcript_31075/g.41084 Transcript_31075/m.41084 type:complete len:244 (+) Transcript_31075:123-854(+)|eukprot:CAMPEP_0117755222 /NCGR_PEP_ID=MMETSP0947-20121206/13320_1 /TAXON_ID=44440 /ORGANISM="Chattonella subsalsa, Strain CCMP2191" /LENGTH=243 /DNA_ID=CAMNT_0005574509 /DNA_START=105 /DNA_END=836 /DNA_ORIENTATION=-
MASRYLMRPMTSRMRSATIFSAGSNHSAAKSLAGLKAVQRWFSAYPDHEVVVMPALSPTMEVGNLGKWRVEVGQEFSPGDVLCEVETDKATVDFEATDEGVVAKHLVEEGASDIACGDPIMVVVQDSADVAAFKDFIIEASAAPTPEPTPEPEPTAQPALEPVKDAAPPEPTPIAPATPEPVATPTPEPVIDASEVCGAVFSSVRAAPSIAGSPLFQRMLKEQIAYNEKFGVCLLEIPTPPSS